MVGLFERTGQQRLFGNRLRGQLEMLNWVLDSGGKIEYSSEDEEGVRESLE